VSQIATDAVYGLPTNQVGKNFLKGLLSQQKALEAEMTHLGEVLAKAVAAYFKPKKAAPKKKLAGGGMLSEPIIGYGLNTGTEYNFAEFGPEKVVPVGGPGGPARMGSMPGGRNGIGPIIINTQEINPIRHAAELGWELARRSA